MRLWLKTTARNNSCPKNRLRLSPQPSKKRLRPSPTTEMSDELPQRSATVKPGRAKDNSPPFQRWAVARTRNESRQGRQNSGSFSDVFFRPFGALRNFEFINPAINRGAIFGCPCGTSTTRGVE